MRKNRLPTREEIDAAFIVDIARGMIFHRPSKFGVGCGKGFPGHRSGKRAGWRKLRKRHGKASGFDRVIEWRPDGRKVRILEQWLIWFCANGQWPNFPTETIDHKNRDSLDNRIENLRLATETQQRANSSKRSSNTTGYKWVMKHGKTYTLRIGGFRTAEEAHAVAERIAKELHGEFFHLD